MQRRSPSVHATQWPSEHAGSFPLQASAEAHSPCASQLSGTLVCKVEQRTWSPLHFPIQPSLGSHTKSHVFPADQVPWAEQVWKVVPASQRVDLSVHSVTHFPSWHSCGQAVPSSHLPLVLQ